MAVVATFCNMLTLVCCNSSLYSLHLHTKSFHTMSGEKILVRFGQNVQRIRKEQNISQEKLAEYAGLHRTYIGMIERAEKNITLCNIEKIAKALNVKISALVD